MYMFIVLRESEMTLKTIFTNVTIKCAENLLYTFTYVKYKQKYTKVYPHTLHRMWTELLSVDDNTNTFDTNLNQCLKIVCKENISEWKSWQSYDKNQYPLSITEDGPFFKDNCWLYAQRQV